MNERCEIYIALMVQLKTNRAKENRTNWDFAEEDALKEKMDEAWAALTSEEEELVEAELARRYPPKRDPFEGVSTTEQYVEDLANAISKSMEELGIDPSTTHITSHTVTYPEGSSIVVEHQEAVDEETSRRYLQSVVGPNTTVEEFAKNVGGIVRDGGVYQGSAAAHVLSQEQYEARIAGLQSINEAQVKLIQTLEGDYRAVSTELRQAEKPTSGQTTSATIHFLNRVTELENTVECLSETNKSLQNLQKPGRLVPKYELDASFDEVRELRARVEALEEQLNAADLAGVASAKDTKKAETELELVKEKLSQTERDLADARKPFYERSTMAFSDAEREALVELMVSPKKSALNTAFEVLASEVEVARLTPSIIQVREELITLRQHTVTMWLKALEKDPNFECIIDATTYDLMQEVKMYPVGPCGTCGTLAPLKDSRCVWGCEDPHLRDYEKHHQGEADDELQG